MEDLAPPLRLLQMVRYALESGESLRTGLRDYLARKPDDMTGTVQGWLQVLERGASTEPLLAKLRSPLRMHLLILFEKGLAGESILPTLASLDEEIQEQCTMEIEGFLAQLSFRMLLPLLFFVLPAFLMLLVGPILAEVTQSMS